MKQIPLNTGRKRSNTLVGLFAMVDDDDYDMLVSRKWSCSFNKHFNGPGYAVTSTGRSTIAMHQVILQAPSGQMIDHIDRNNQVVHRIHTERTVNLVSRSIA